MNMFQWIFENSYKRSTKNVWKHLKASNVLNPFENKQLCTNRKLMHNYLILVHGHWRHRWKTYKENSENSHEWHTENSMSPRSPLYINWIKSPLQQKLGKFHVIKGMLRFVMDNVPKWSLVKAQKYLPSSSYLGKLFLCFHSGAFPYVTHHS